MSCSLNSLKVGSWGLCRAPVVGLIRGDTRSLDYTHLGKCSLEVGCLL